MSRKVRVTTIAENHRAYDGSGDYEKITKMESDFIIGEINKVLHESPDLIVLPEVYDRPGGIPRNVCRNYYNYRGNYIYDRVKETAKNNNVNIVFSAVMDGSDGYMRNRQMFIGRNGEELGLYDKNHLVWEEHTESNIAFGDDPKIINADIGKLGGVICYDLNFDELREKYTKLKPEILCFSSMYHGGYVARNWAYTNRCFFVASVQNRQGYIINPLGEVIAEMNPYISSLTAEINLDYVVAHIDYNVPGGKVRALKEKYGALAEISTPMGLGCIMITSHHPEVSAPDMAKEFEIELLDDLFARGRKQREEFLSKK